MKYSFVVPIFNDGALADDFCVEFERVFRERLATDGLEGRAEVIFVDDGSQNDSVALLQAAAKRHRFVKAIALSRNFGQHVAITCGYRHATGDFVGMLNVDQEDPIDQLPLLLDALEADTCDIANGLYLKRRAPLGSRITSFGFNWFLGKLTGYETPTRISTMRAMNRKFLDAYNGLEERRRYIPGLESWLGFRRVYVDVRHQVRKKGRSSYDFRRRWRMAWDAVISFSDLPLRMAVRFGFLIAASGLAFLGYIVFEKLFLRDMLPGWASTVAVIVFLGGVQIAVTGIASLYIGRILAEVQGRPLFVVREKFGFETSRDEKALRADEGRRRDHAEREDARDAQSVSRGR